MEQGWAWIPSCSIAQGVRIVCKSQNDLQYYCRWLLETPEIPTCCFSELRFHYVLINAKQ
jgi:hypothetical protein